jgi:hypothetical protein
MKLLNDWGATKSRFHLALGAAALEGQVEAMELLRSWGTTNYYLAVANAAAKGRVEILHLL